MTCAVRLSQTFTDQPPCAKPPPLSSPGPPGACMTPSRVRKVLTISFLISVVLSIGSRLESSPRQEETPQRRETHRKRVPDESGRGFAEPGDGLLDAFVERDLRGPVEAGGGEPAVEAGAALLARLGRAVLRGEVTAGGGGDEAVQRDDVGLLAGADIVRAAVGSYCGEQVGSDHVVDVDVVPRLPAVPVDRRDLATHQPLGEDRDHAGL